MSHARALSQETGLTIGAALGFAVLAVLCLVLGSTAGAVAFAALAVACPVYFTLISRPRRS